VCHIIYNEQFVILIVSLVVSSLFYTLSLKPEEANDKTESYVKSQTSNQEVRISGKHEQSFFTSTDALEKRVNISSDYNPLTPEIQESDANTSYPVEAARLKYIQKLLKKEIEEAADVLQFRDSDGITYIPVKKTNQTEDGIRHEFLNASRISESFAITESAVRKKDGETKKIENKFEEESLTGLLNNTSVKTNISKSLSNAKNNTPQQVKFLQEWNTGVQANKDSDISNISVTEAHSTKKSSDISIRLTNITKTRSAESKTDNQTLESRTDQENWEIEEDGLLEAANFGLQAMHDLYYIQEPKLYSMGKHLKKIH